MTLNRTALLSLALLLVPAVGFAQDDAAPDPGGDAAAPAGGGETVEGAQQATGFKFDLRFWHGQSTPIEGRGEQKETFHLPMWGFTGTYSPASLENFGFMLTFMAGFGEGDVDELSDAYLSKGDQETFRFDVEILIRYTLPESPVYLFVGFRSVNWEEEGDQFAIDGGDAGLIDTTVDAAIFLFELGLGLTGNITPDGVHRIFANMVFGLGWLTGDYDYSDIFQSGISLFDQVRYDLDWDTEFAFSFDGNLGYQASLTDVIDLSVRYRVFLIAADLTRGSDQDNLVIHGLEASLGFRF